MKLKYYLRGAGMGVIITTLILTIAFHTVKTEESSSEPATETQDLTIAEALSDADAAARETESEPSEAADTEDAVTEAESEAAPAESKETTETESEEAGDEAIEVPEPAGETSAEEASQEEPATATDRPAVTREVTVVHGDSPGMVARKLHDTGIIEDEDGFYQYLVSHGLNDLLEVGTFSIPVGADFSEIARILTTNEYERRVQ